jgi:hypothetical protein
LTVCAHEVNAPYNNCNFVSEGSIIALMIFADELWWTRNHLNLTPVTSVLLSHGFQVAYHRRGIVAAVLIAFS